MDGASMLSGVLGLILGLILFAIGIVWLIFPFIVNSWLKKIHSEMESNTQEARNLVQETIKANQLLAQSLVATKAAAVSNAKKKTAPVPIADPPTSAHTLTLSKDGQNIGEYTLTNVRQMLKSQQITLQDMYFDRATQEWTALDLHPSLY